MQPVYDKQKRWNPQTNVLENVTLANEEKEIVVVTHDETIVYSNDAKRVCWLQDGQGDLRPKGQGNSLHISGFCCQCHGFAEHNGQKTYKIIQPGKNKDGYWTNADLVVQFNEVVPVFKALHPNCELLFIFDNSSNHHAKAPDGLDVSYLNLSDGGASNKHKLRETVMPDGTPQQMQLPNETRKVLEQFFRSGVAGLKDSGSFVLRLSRAIRKPLPRVVLLGP